MLGFGSGRTLAIQASDRSATKSAHTPRPFGHTRDRKAAVGSIYVVGGDAATVRPHDRQVHAVSISKQNSFIIIVDMCRRIRNVRSGMRKSEANRTLFR